MFANVQYKYWRESGNAVMGAIANKGLETEVSALVKFDVPVITKAQAKEARGQLIQWLRNYREDSTDI